MPTTMWRRRFLYRVTFPLLHRRGRERFRARWQPVELDRSQERQAAAPEVDLGVVE